MKTTHILPNPVEKHLWPLLPLETDPSKSCGTSPNTIILSCDIWFPALPGWSFLLKGHRNLDIPSCHSGLVQEPCCLTSWHPCTLDGSNTSPRQGSYVFFLGCPFLEDFVSSRRYVRHDGTPPLSVASNITEHLDTNDSPTRKRPLNLQEALTGALDCLEIP